MQINQKHYHSLDIDDRGNDIIQIWGIGKISTDVIQVERENIPRLISILEKFVKTNIEDRKAVFVNEVSLMGRDYPDEMLTEFCKYWTEHSDKAKKMRFEKEKSWNTKLRLERWSRNNKRYGKQTNENRLQTLSNIRELSSRAFPNHFDYPSSTENP
jgi:hypothetical protein